MNPRNPISRRRFLKTLGKTSFGIAAAGTFLGALPEVAKGARRLQIIILGAGLAGLCTAYELEKLGHSVTVLEAEPTRIGGRVRTHRFAGGHYGELGAMRIPSSHATTRRYVQELGLELRPFVNYNPEGYYLVGGTRRRLADVPSLDRRFAGQATGSFWGQSFDEIVGGNDGLPLALALRLQSPPRLGCEVVSIEQYRTCVRVNFLDHGVAAQMTADYVVCTIPFSVIRKKIQLFASFSPRKRQAINGISYGSAEKVLALVERRFWESDDGIYGGGSYTDLPTGSMYYPSDNTTARNLDVSASAGVLLGSYAIAEVAREFEAWPVADRPKRTLDCLVQLHPQLAQPGIILDEMLLSWDEQPWSQGAFAKDGQDMQIPSAQAADGRVHFAGEHTSKDVAWMQGALDSASRVVAEMAYLSTR